MVEEGAHSSAGKGVEGARLHHDAFGDVRFRGVQRGHGVGVADLERDDAHRPRVAVPLHLGEGGRGYVGWSEREIKERDRPEQREIKERERDKREG